MAVTWRRLVVALMCFEVAHTETVDYGYGVDSGNHVEVSGTHVLSGTVTSTGASAPEPLFKIPTPTT